MKKTYQLKNLDCANCARKIEDAIAKVDGVTKTQVNFMMQTLVLEAEDEKFDAAVIQAKKLVKKIEPDTVLVV